MTHTHSRSFTKTEKPINVVRVTNIMAEQVSIRSMEEKHGFRF